MAQKFRTLIAKPEGEETFKDVLGRRQKRLNELGLEGWTLATSLYIGDQFIDTLSQSIEG
jgi:hypothetical protein